VFTQRRNPRGLSPVRLWWRRSHAAASPSNEIFAAKFCRHFAVPMERYTEEILRRALYPQARLTRPFLPAEAFAADRDFVACAGRLTRRRDFPGEAVEFHDAPGNRRFWRRHAKCRVSVKRVQRLFDLVWP